MNRKKLLGSLLGLSLSVSLIVVAAVAGGQTPITAGDSYRILITNDDGIDSPGIRALVETLGAQAEVMVVAPAENRSASSHSTETLRTPFRVSAFHRDGEAAGYAVDGTPADAARFGLLELGKDDPFDLVVSGINEGENVGHLAHVSGTVGAAKEALLHGVPAIAVSQSRRRGDDYLTAARFTARIVEQVRARGLPPGVLLSINVPAGQLAGAVAVRMAGSEFRYDGYRREGSDGDATVYRLRLGFQRPVEGGDTRAFLAGHVTVTPLRIDWTDYDTLAELAGWDLGLR